jgi:hypothetical protein
LLALFRVRQWESLNHQDHAVNEWRTKTTSQFLRNRFRFATFDAGCGLQMALGVKGKWKKRKDGRKDYPGQPKTAQMHAIHDVMQNRSSNTTDGDRRPRAPGRDEVVCQSP